MTLFLILMIISIIIYTCSFLVELALNELHFDSGEQRQLNELLPKIVGLAEFLTSAIPVISSSFKLLFDRYSKIPNLSKSVDVVLIRHSDNTGSSSISTKDESCLSSSINDESGEEFCGHHTIYFKDVTSRFYFFFIC